MISDIFINIYVKVHNFLGHNMFMGIVVSIALLIMVGLFVYGGFGVDKCTENEKSARCIGSIISMVVGGLIWVLLMTFYPKINKDNHK
jgi:hypothetical protein